ncbi:MAG: isocitrate lyase/phosphoenolpyruvate mutase family protein [Pseudomonadota bacterium]
MLNSKAETFKALHQTGAPFIMPNPWDAGSARILEHACFQALATTSAGFALTLGREDYGVTREEALAHAATIAASVDVPVSADFENGFGPTPEDAAETIRQAAKTELAGGSIEDSTGDDEQPIFEEALAVERIAAAAEVAQKTGFVLTARAEALLHGHAKLEDVIRQLQKYSDAGADILFAPGLPDLTAVKQVCASIDKPVNVLVMGELTKCSVEDLAGAGVARISVGSGLAWSAYAALASDAAEIMRAQEFGTLRNRQAESALIKDVLKSKS